MSWHNLAGGPLVGCSGGNSCEQVLNSQWSTIAGIVPVSGLAIGVYMAMFIAIFFIDRFTEESIKHQAWSVLLILSGCISGSALWFTFIQKWIIGYFCPYCMTVHMAGLLLASLVFWRATAETVEKEGKSFKLFGFWSVVLKGGAGLLISGAFAGSQMFFAPSTFVLGKSKDSLPTVNYNYVPIIGSPDAPFMVTLLFDYQCSHCQKIHLMLNEVVSRYNGKLAFVLGPTPLNSNCNPYVPKNVDAFENSCEMAKIGLAVWVSKREAFMDFENWFFSFDKGNAWHPKSLEASRAKAIELVGEAKFKAAIGDSWVGEYLQMCTLIYGKTLQNGRGGVPKLIFGSQWVIPEPKNADDFINILQNSFAVPKP